MSISSATAFPTRATTIPSFRPGQANSRRTRALSGPRSLLSTSVCRQTPPRRAAPTTPTAERGSTLLPGVVDPPVDPNSAVPVATQVTQYLSHGPADPNALYSLQGGGNDFFYQFGLLLAGATTPAQVQAALGQAASRPREAGRNSEGRRCAIHHGLGSSRCRDEPGRRRNRTRGYVDGAVELLQFDAHGEHWTHSAFRPFALTASRFKTKYSATQRYTA